MCDMPMNKNAVISSIYEQSKSESDAKMNYHKFLACFGSKLQPKDVAVIEEIIADEENHNLKLLAMAKKYSGIAPTDDDLAEALSFLGGKK